MDALLSNPVHAWLAFGALLIALEALTAPGLGIFLGGLGAICTAVLVQVGVVNEAAVALQFACFFGLTVVWAVVLWRPLMRFRIGGRQGKSPGFSNMVGDKAVVGERGLKRGEIGQVIWSGTLMNAQLDDAASVSALPAGAQVEIKSVSGNILKVTPT